MYKILIIFSCCIAIGCSSVPKLSHTDKPVIAADDVWSTGNIAAFEKKLEELRNHYHIPSIAIGIVNEKKLVVRGGSGFADIKKQIKPDENTVYHLASITKTFGSINLFFVSFTIAMIHNKIFTKLNSVQIINPISGAGSSILFCGV